MAPMTAACMTYAGIGPRTFALLVDALVFAPVLAIFIILFDRLQTVPAMLVYMGYGALGGAYDIYFLTRWGQTLGKMAAKIRVARLGGGVITFRHALLRNSVDITLWLVQAVSIAYLLVSWPEPEWSAMSMADQRRRLAERGPFGGNFELISYLWIGSELIVLLFNKKRRALHDFIAGTVVVRIEAEK